MAGLPLQAQPNEDPGSFSAVFLAMASPDEPASVAIQWTGDPAAQLELWVDFDGDGIWNEPEKLLDGVALTDKVVVFDLALPTGSRLRPEQQARFRVSGKTPLEKVQSIGDSVPPMPSSTLSAPPVPAMEGGAAGGQAEECDWVSGFHIQGMNDIVYATAVFDDGTGPALYAAGAFVSADDAVVNRVAKWDGTRWTALEIGLNSTALALVVFDDGSGPALYVGGAFTVAGFQGASRVAKWDGTSWSRLGSGLNNTVWDLTVYDDGTGPALYAGGLFTFSGGESINRVAKWDGSAWSALGAGQSNPVLTLTVFDDGTGDALYTGGYPTGGNPLHVSKWDGSAWANVGSGMGGRVWDLAVFDDGTGPALFAGGFFLSAGGVSVNRVAKWDGSAWSPLGSGMDALVTSLKVYDDGSGPALYAGGDFTSAGGVTASGFAKWDGTAWTVPGDGPNGGIWSWAEYDDGSGSALYAAGHFTSAGGVTANRVAKWDGSTWSMPSGIAESGLGTDSQVRALVVHDDGSGSALYVGGLFTAAGGVDANYIARWDDKAWTAVGGGLDSSVYDFATYDDGSGLALYAAGFFTAAGGVDANYIAKWDGTSWSPLGEGVSYVIRDLEVYDDGSGAALYAAGLFDSAGGTSANSIAKWDGTSWSPVGSGTNIYIEALTVFDDGGGEALYAGGAFTTAGGVDANYIAKWDGTSWTALGSGMDGRVRTLGVYDDGSGEALYAGGEFSMAGGLFASRIAKWDGSAWTEVGLFGMNNWVSALAVHDDGNGPALYAGGIFTNAGGNTARRIARWDGTEWQDVASGLGYFVNTLASFDAGAGPVLYAGGAFGTSGDLVSAHFAKYSCGPSLSLPPMTEIASGTTTTLPILLDLRGPRVASASFSIDYDQGCLDPDVDGDGNLDNLISNLPADFTVTAHFDPADTDGEIDITIADVSPPFALLESGELLSIDFQANCTGSPTAPIDAPIQFSPDPSPTFGDPESRVVVGTWSDGTVRIWPGQRGDCDSSGALDAEDLNAISLEIFDSDGELWTDAPGSDFVGSPVGCDANASTTIRAADVVCANILAQAGICSGAESFGAGPELTITARVEDGPPGELVWIRVDTRQMQDVSSLAFSLDLDPALFDFAAVDGDGDGVPDQLRYPLGAPDFSVVLWSDSDTEGELDILISDLSGQPLAEGGLLEVGIPLLTAWSEQGIALAQTPALSFGSTTGSDRSGTARVFLGIFADDFESGDSARWTFVVD